MFIDIPPQIEQQIIETAKQQNVSVAELVIASFQESQAKKELEDEEEFFRLTGIRPLKGKHLITNDYINELREQYGI